MNRPSFLIVGAQKAGTTSVYADLDTNPEIFFPDDKELQSLCHDSVLSEAGRASYFDHFRQAAPSQVCGEASTGYTMRPDADGAAERAGMLLSADLKIIYVVRQPIGRITSHHHHSFVTGRAPSDINSAVREQPEFVNWTKYSMQIRPWLDQFGSENVRIVRFEDYTAARRDVIAALSRFIGVTPRVDQIDVGQVFNRSEGKPVESALWRRALRHPIYREAVRPWVPRRVRARLRRVLLPRATASPSRMSLETARWIWGQLEDDMEALRRLTGRAEPLWEWRDVVQSRLLEGA